MKPANTALLAAFALAAAPALADDLTVSAAASLKEAFQEINAAYQKAHPDTAVKLNTAASGVLLQQLAQGAPVDVLATADQTTMDKAQEQNLIDQSHRRTFALNDLVVVQPKDSRLKIKTLADLKAATVGRIAAGNPDSVPAGRYTKGALEKAGLYTTLQPKIVSTQNVRQALDYVARGETEAGFVYRTDAVLAKDKVRTAFAVALETPVSYAIAPAAAAKNKAAASYVDFVLSPAGQTILKKYGFSPAKGSKAK
ncbi:Molybdate-binding periplasmic protein precursor [Kingella potus]|uniref:Molybdate-binding periplasmic protein n=1 Tax=Kingella potus TaxID=265175 RepID=A0A377QX69_9NEIS|nr:molybdate ABC transporter substrate-binding protein [Kingella potus]STR00004.1 Molybdate-binding periplasmic protein precursor [Kingella potus]